MACMIQRTGQPAIAIPALLVTLMTLALASAALAQSARTLTVYRCTGRDGQVTFRNDRACEKGERQQARRIQAPAPAIPPAVESSSSRFPAPMAQAPAPAREPEVAAHFDAAPAPLPPPPLYRCHTYDGNSYLNDDGAPPERCLPLRVSGIDGSRDNRSGAQACEMQQDHCERIPDQQLCQAWGEYDRQAQSLVALDNPDTAAKANTLFARTRKVMTTTTCAEAGPGRTRDP